jgi:hypothetical protein
MPKQKPTTPAPLGTIWIAEAKLQVINTDTMRWETLATCCDTPNAIRQAVRELCKDTRYSSRTIWVKPYIGDRYIIRTNNQQV